MYRRKDKRKTSEGNKIKTPLKTKLVKVLTLHRPHFLQCTGMHDQHDHSSEIIMVVHAA